MRQKEAAQKVVEQTAAELGCMLTIADVANAKHVKYGLKKQTFDYGNYKKLEITLAGKFQVANAVLAEDVVVGTGDVVATVYIRGIFNAEEMSVGSESDSVQAHEEELRAVGIYLTHLQ